MCYLKGLGYNVSISQATIEASTVGLCHLHKTLETKGAKPPRLPRESQTQGLKMDTKKDQSLEDYYPPAELPESLCLTHS